MLIVGASLVVILIAVILSVQGEKLPMDRDVIHRIRRIAEDRHREQLLPFD
jgi:hypothetical protein